MSLTSSVAPVEAAKPAPPPPVESLPKAGPLIEYSEMFRQRFLPGHTFLKTPNQRNKRMLTETAQHERLAKSFLKKVKAIAKATENLLLEAEHVVSGPLPREFTMRGGILQVVGEGLQAVEKAAGTPTPTTDTLGVNALRDKFQADLRTRIFAPLEEWFAEHMRIMREFRETESVRFQLDGLRRKLLSIDQAKGRAEQRGLVETPKYKKSVDRKSHLESQIDAMKAAYASKESAVNADLKALIAKSEEIKGIVCEAFEIESETLAGLAKPGGFVEQSFAAAIRPDLHQVEEEEQEHEEEETTTAKYTVADEE